MVNVVEAQVRVSQANGRKQRIVLTEITVGCYVDVATRAAAGTENLFCGFVAYKEFCVRKYRAERVDLGLDRRCLSVRDAQDQGFSGVIRGFGLTQRVDIGAGRLGNGKAVDEVRVSVV